MSREIMFRVYDKVSNQYIKQAEGFHILGEVMAFGVIEQYLAKKNVDRLIRIQWSDLVLEQFTGIYDSNDKAIYECDIIKHYRGTGEVWYREDIAAFVVDGQDDDGNYDGVYQLTRGEVIGNKHQNMELLKNCLK